ncbi:PxxKW family cysteine-rich protein [Thermodesulfobacteriota bacterium]
MKNGIECAFMTRKGCNFNGGHCHKVVEACEGCSRSHSFQEGTFCTVAPEPSVKWSLGSCNFATHIERSKSQAKEQKINPLKASKRAAAGKSN